MKAPSPISSRSLRGGFTLIELLVSSAIIGVMMMILLSATSASLGMWRGAERRIAVDREGRTGMALMADDLANMMVMTAVPPKFSPPDANGVFMQFPVLRPGDYQEQSSGNVGDVCFVLYRYDSVQKRIFRSHVDSKATFDSVKLGSAPPASAYELLADNVTELNVNTYDVQGKSGTSATNTNSVNLSIGVVDRQEMENVNRGISIPDGKTSKQYFSVTFAVPRTQ
jgi:prepilin-type N-terminal cleavage/methylation domain-containing protein